MKRPSLFHMVLFGYSGSSLVWALVTWPVAPLWCSLAALLVVLALIWPILTQLLYALAAHTPTGPRGRAYAVWMAATVLTRGPVFPRLLVALDYACVGGSVLLSALALVAVHPLLVPFACAPLALRDPLRAWVLHQHPRSDSPKGDA